MYASATLPRPIQSHCTLHSPHSCPHGCRRTTASCAPGQCHLQKEFIGVWHIVEYLLTQGVKEGCPLSSSIFVLVYNAFHSTLAKEFSVV